MKFGVCYYPEHWPEARWAVDARMMRDSGIEIVRIAEFAWSRMEPTEGQFDFDWLDRAIDTLSGFGHKVVLGTPTATPPAWLSRNYPETLPIDAEGRRRNFGSRRHYCPNTPIYREYSATIVSEMARRYVDHPSVIGWQIDNEFGGGRTTYCYCEDCARAFQHWLQQRYTSLDGLNTAWGTVFWSQEYSEWNQITAPNLTGGKPNPSQQLDYFRFSSDTWMDYQRFQINLLKQQTNGFDQFVTHNMMGLFFQDINYFDLAKDLDFVTVDNYPTGGIDRVQKDLYIEEEAPVYAVDAGDPVLTHLEFDLMRGLKDRAFWVMEQQPGLINWSTYNTYIPSEMVRLWSWHAALQGADTLVFFRWRAARFAQEQYHAGLLKHDGSPDVGMAALKKLNNDRASLAKLLSQPRKAEAAMILRYDDLWSFRIQPHRRGFTYAGHFFSLYRALTRLGIQVDIRPPDAELDKYKLVIAPAPHLNEAGFVANLTGYVRRGGNLLATVRAGFKTLSNVVVDEPLPGSYRDLLGLRVPQWTALAPGAAYRIGSEVPGLVGEASIWADALAPESAVSLASYEDGPFKGLSALTRNPFGAGAAYVLGWHPTHAQSLSIMDYLADACAVRRTFRGLPEGVLAVQRGSDTALLNFTASTIQVDVDGEDVPVPARDVWLGVHRS
jgi:beta-galactosidase